MRLLHPVTATLASLLALGVAPACAPAQSSGYHVASRVKIGGDGGWDYLVVDTANDHIFVSRGTHTMVIDTRTDSVVGDIQDTPGVHGIALAPALGRAFISNGRDSSVTVVDLKTLVAVARIRGTGANPDAIAYDSASDRVFTFNGRSADATVIDAATNRIVGTIPLGGKPEFAVTDGRGALWVNIEDRSEIVRVDTRSMKVAARWSLGPCEEPTGLAIDRVHRRLFSVCANGRMAVVDADAGKVVATVPIGAGPDGAAFDPQTQLVFSSNGEGTLTVAHEDSPDRYSVVQTVETQRGARTLALDPRTHVVYTVTAEFGPRPAPTAENPRPRPAMVAGSFTLLLVRM